MVVRDDVAPRIEETEQDEGPGPLGQVADEAGDDVVRREQPGEPALSQLLPHASLPAPAQVLAAGLASLLGRTAPAARQGNLGQDAAGAERMGPFGKGCWAGGRVAVPPVRWLSGNTGPAEDLTRAVRWPAVRAAALRWPRRPARR